MGSALSDVEALSSVLQSLVSEFLGGLLIVIVVRVLVRSRITSSISHGVDHVVHSSPHIGSNLLISYVSLPVCFLVWKGMSSSLCVCLMRLLVFFIFFWLSEGCGLIFSPESVLLVVGSAGLGVERGSVRVREGVSGVGKGLITAWIQHYHFLGLRTDGFEAWLSAQLHVEGAVRESVGSLENRDLFSFGAHDIILELNGLVIVEGIALHNDILIHVLVTIVSSREEPGAPWSFALNRWLEQ